VVSVAATVRKDVEVVAASVFKGAGKDGHSREILVGVDGLCESHHVRCQPGLVDGHRVERVAQDFPQQGALASLLGTFEAARPNGSVAQATQYFEQAMRDGAGEQAGPFVAKAESIALVAQDRVMFEQLLHQALEVATRHRNLQNEVMRERAVWLLDMTDDLF
jgi:hypothetical protein